eukprot:5029161-Heterocapsa_arctica.AAC.1
MRASQAVAAGQPGASPQDGLFSARQSQSFWAARRLGALAPQWFRGYQLPAPPSSGCPMAICHD